MKIIIDEKIVKDPSDLSLNITFRIIGPREEKSLQIPMWESVYKVSKDELVQGIHSDVFKTSKRKNALSVFEKFYNDCLLNK